MLNIVSFVFWIFSRIYHLCMIRFSKVVESWKCFLFVPLSILIIVLSSFSLFWRNDFDTYFAFFINIVETFTNYHSSISFIYAHASSLHIDCHRVLEGDSLWLSTSYCHPKNLCSNPVSTYNFLIRKICTSIQLTLHSISSHKSRIDYPGISLLNLDCCFRKGLFFHVRISKSQFHSLAIN